MAEATRAQLFYDRQVAQFQLPEWRVLIGSLGAVANTCFGQSRLQVHACIYIFHYYEERTTSLVYEYKRTVNVDVNRLYIFSLI